MLLRFILILALFVQLLLNTSAQDIQGLTFNEDIAPIIFQKCSPCHHPGNIAPMPFTNYKEVAAYGSMIRYVTGIRYMPPWKPQPSSHSFKHNRQLSDLEIERIAAWVDGGLLEGDATKLPLLPVFADTTEMEKPDAVLSMSEAFEQYGVYYDQYRVFVLPTSFETDKAISEIEFVPGNRSIVRSCFISIDTSDAVQALDDWDPQYGYFSFGELGFVPNQSRWYTWHPGKGKTVYASGTGKILPQGAKLLLHIHYGPTGVPRKDQSRIQLKFSKEPPKRIIQNLPLISPYDMTNPFFRIPAEEVIRYHAKFTVPFDIELLALMPHCHLLGARWEIFTKNPETNTSENLLKIDDWDFSWKQQYEFIQPVVLTKGTEVHALATYDNTLDNLSNPNDPPRQMDWGKRMFEELFLAYFEFVPQATGNENLLRISTNTSLVTTSYFPLSFYNSQKRTLHCWIEDMEGKICLEVFKDKKFKKGNHRQYLPVDHLQKGNYVLVLSDEKEKIEARQIFILVDADLLE